MTDNVIIYKDENGRLAITRPWLDCGLTIEEIAEKDTPQGIAYKIMDSADLPEDHTFRDAWDVKIDKPDGFGLGPEKWNSLYSGDGYLVPKAISVASGTVISTNMALAKMVWRTKMAIARDNKIADMNRLYQIYIDNGVDPAPIVERRSALRQVTQDPAIDAATTPEELKAVWPSILDDDV